MTTISRETNNISLDKLIELAKHGPVIITQGDTPVFAFLPVSEDDLKTWRLGENPEFLELMRRSWDRLRTEGGMSLAEARRQLLSE